MGNLQKFQLKKKVTDFIVFSIMYIHKKKLQIKVRIVFANFVQIPIFAYGFYDHHGKTSFLIALFFAIMFMDGQ